MNRKTIASTLVAALVLVGAVTSAQAIQRQRTQNWCWASAIQDVLSQASIYQSQAQIAARLDGWPQDRPAYIGEVAGLLRSYRLRAQRAGRPGSPQELAGTLSNGYRIIAFVRPSNGPVGHYIVLQGIDPFGNVVVSDPWTGGTNRQPLSALYYQWHWMDSVVVGR